MNLRFLPLLVTLFTGVAAAQTLEHVRVDSADAVRLSEEFEATGWDVVEGSATASSFELIVNAAELNSLRTRGIASVHLATGRPFADIQAAKAAKGVPPGYLDLAGIEGAMAIAAATYPSICRMVDLTTTYGVPPTAEGRHMFAVVISDNVQVEEDEPTALIVSAHHCRELVTPVIALNAIDQLTSGYATNPQITSIVDQNEIWIAPIWNPDGYNHVFQVDNMWRKNRRLLPTGQYGVDLNRNYPFGWSSACSGSTTTSSQTYKGPTPGSESETQTMMALSMDRHFAKVIDFHSSGREVLWGYDCSTHPLAGYLQAEAIGFSQMLGYNGDERSPSAEGEHYEWQLAATGAHSFLVETSTEFQPSYASAQSEAALVWPGIAAMLAHAIPIAGHLRDLCAGESLEGEVILPNVSYVFGETHPTGGPFDTYHAFVPPGPTSVQFAAPGFQTASATANVKSGVSWSHDESLTSQTAVALVGTGKVGTTLTLQLTSLADAGAPFFAAIGASGSSPGTPVGACGLALNWDPLVAYSIGGSAPFQNFIGVFDGAGSATAPFSIPADANLVGMPVDFAYLTIDATSFKPRHFSNAAHLVIGQ